jgi:hypothetical protein
MSILHNAINAERAQRRSGTNEAPERSQAAANEIDPARVAALASALTGTTKSQDKKYGSYSMPCMQCGCVNTFTDDDLDGWKTNSETSSTDGDDSENGDDSDDDSRKNDGDDDGSDYDDKLKTAVNAAVLAERAAHIRSINQVKTLIEAMNNLRKSR